MVSSENEEDFDFSISNVVFGVYKINALYFLEEISYFRIDPFTLLDIDLPANSYMIACTNTQNFVEEGENCASTILVGSLGPLFHTIGSNMILFGSDMNLFGSIFKFQELPVMLIAVLINPGVKNQVPQSPSKLLLVI